MAFFQETLSETKMGVILEVYQPNARLKIDESLTAKRSVNSYKHKGALAAMAHGE